MIFIRNILCLICFVLFVICILPAYVTKLCGHIADKYFQDTIVYKKTVKFAQWISEL